MELKKKDLKALRRVRDRERISMKLLCLTIGVLRGVCVPHIPADDFGATVHWFVGLTPEVQAKLLDDAMGVNNV